MKKFVQYLDTHKTATMKPNEYWYLIHNINANYHENRIGPSIIPYYMGAYDTWQKTNEAVIIPEPLNKRIDTFIETDIESISDLLKIIDEIN